ncbi:unnamed protein product [Linum tenue]|uniref:Uncharacterized protein n=1 Tax=Linum tenue TaxID=586396 RepID=A0AAV0L2G3_9ROSI|nr:unnamed protein product [Linum tenue]
MMMARLYSGNLEMISLRNGSRWKLEYYWTFVSEPMKVHHTTAETLGDCRFRLLCLRDRVFCACPYTQTVLAALSPTTH